VTGVGYRSVPHTADIRIEAWAPTREQCLAEAVRALVAGFADTAASPATRTSEALIDPGTDEDLLLDLLNEVIYRLETEGMIPLAAEVEALPRGLRVRFEMTDADRAEPIGAAPKAVSLHDLRLTHDGGQWSCTATVDV
jgi:SHS2 domain-containing protein